MATCPGWLRPLLTALAELVSLLLPEECPGCGRPGEQVCRACRAAASGPARRLHVTGWPTGPPAWAGVPYRGRVRRLVVAWKDRGRHDLTEVLADALTAALLGLLRDLPVPDAVPMVPVLMVPVPSSRRSRRRRGDDVVLRLAFAAAARARSAGVALRVVPALRVCRPVADQAGLGRAGRARNVTGAMAPRPGAAVVLAGRVCVVVDDVITTGATAREAVRVLTDCRARVVGVAAACGTPLRRRLSGDPHLD